MKMKVKISLITSICLMIFFFLFKTSVLFGLIPNTQTGEIVEYLCFILFCPPFYFFTREYVNDMKESHQETVDQLRYKNTYLEHAAKILRHDMHSGINVYIPRGISSLERRLTKESIEQLKLEAPLRLLKEGLAHTQKIYKGVYEFTNLVKQGTAINMQPCSLTEILTNYLSTTGYKEQVIIDMLPTINVNEPLFCTAIDNLIRNGLRYNDSENKMVVVYQLDDRTIVVQDNGRGMTQEEFEYFSKNGTRREGQKESGSGLGLGICVAILKEHGFDVNCEKLEEGGSQIKITIHPNKNEIK
jgi:K+-sensing histidine kinase KdpD